MKLCLTIFFTVLVSVCIPCLLVSSERQDPYLSQLLTRVETYIQQETAYHDKPSMVQLIHELQGSPVYLESGSDALRVKFVAVQGAFEHVLSLAYASGELVELVGYIHTPAPATPLCMRPDENPAGLMTGSNSQDFDRRLAVESRARIVRDYLRRGGKLNILYPKNGFIKRSPEQQAIYLEALKEFPNLMDGVLTCEAIPSDRIGATYLFSDQEGVIYAFAIKSYQANDSKENAEWGFWLGRLTDPSIRARIDAIVEGL